MAAAPVGALVQGRVELLVGSACMMRQAVARSSKVLGKIRVISSGDIHEVSRRTGTDADETRAHSGGRGSNTCAPRRMSWRHPVADIAAELGMSPANVYRFFPSGDAITSVHLRADGEQESPDIEEARSAPDGR